jgi:hypothetical protein
LKRAELEALRSIDIQQPLLWDREASSSARKEMLLEKGRARSSTVQEEPKTGALRASFDISL